MVMKMMMIIIIIIIIIVIIIIDSQISNVCSVVYNAHIEKIPS